MDFPSNNDKLFREENESHRDAWIQNPVDKFFLY